MKNSVNFLESETMKNVARSFASECMEGAKYQFMATQCLTENLNFLQMTFKTLAKHEMSHAKVFWDILHQNSNGKILKNVELNFGYPFDCQPLESHLHCASENERYLSDSIYPEFAKIAKQEGFLDIAHTFDLVATVENCHSMLLEQIHKKYKSNKLYKSPETIKWKCSKCGFEHDGKQPPAPCPLCQNEKGYYEIPFDMGE